jgi:hypothetical protein
MTRLGSRLDHESQLRDRRRIFALDRSLEFRLRHAGNTQRGDALTI